MACRSTKKPHLGGGEVKEERGPEGKATKEGGVEENEMDGVEENEMECLGCLRFCNRYFRMPQHFFFLFCNTIFFLLCCICYAKMLNVFYFKMLLSLPLNVAKYFF